MRKKRVKRERRPPVLAGERRPKSRHGYGLQKTTLWLPVESLERARAHALAEGKTLSWWISNVLTKAVGA
jgi:hypothetical protein